MSALDAKAVKDAAMRFGADAVGIASLDRFDGAPPEMDPRYIAPRARSLIGMIFRIPRGYLRGCEEGTHFFQYPSMGYGAINENIAPTTLYETARFIEDRGYEGVVYRNTGGRSARSDMTGVAARVESPELHRVSQKGGTNSSPNVRSLLARPSAEGLPAPDVFIHFRIAAFLCGLGEIGYSKMLLTPQFGPLNRQAFLLTDAELEPDPIYDGPQLCNRCMACVAACPGQCISREEQIKIELADHDVSWGKLDEWKCFAYYIGANKATNPFMPRDAFKDIPDGAALMRGDPSVRITAESYTSVNDAINRHYPAEPGGYNPPKCGGCLRACLHSLEVRGVLNRHFNERFRTRKPWKLENGAC